MQDPCFWDVTCETHLGCGICDMDTPPVYTMRGLCSLSKFDSHYGWTGELSDGLKYSFRGFAKSALFWNKTENYWQLQYNKNASIFAFFNATTENRPYPFGKNKWYFVNDEKCHIEENKISETIHATYLSFSPCNDNEFNCDDGTW